MFSGKSEELIRRLHRASLARQTTVAIKPSIDNRYDAEQICSHSGARHAAHVVPPTDAGVRQILEIGLQPVHVVGIEEVQFFPPSIVDVCRRLQYAGRRVIVAGLDMDAKGQPFGSVPILLAMGSVYKMTAICQSCGDEAQHSYRKTGGDVQVEVGVSQYEARCYKCWSRASGHHTPDLEEPLTHTASYREPSSSAGIRSSETPSYQGTDATELVAASR